MEEEEDSDFDNPQNKDLGSIQESKGSLPRKEETTQVRMDPHSTRAKQGKKAVATRREGYEEEVVTPAK